MTAAPGPQQPDEVRPGRSPIECLAAAYALEGAVHLVDDDEAAQVLATLADQWRREAEAPSSCPKCESPFHGLPCPRVPAAPSAQPDEVRPGDLVTVHLPGAMTYIGTAVRRWARVWEVEDANGGRKWVGSAQLTVQPVRDTREGS